jgi:hypothetical protein
MFTAADLQARIKERPFVPVRIVTSSGQSYDITHPDLVWIAKTWVMIGTPSNDNPSILEVANRVAILHITDLQDIPHASHPGKNGPPA